MLVFLGRKKPAFYNSLLLIAMFCDLVGEKEGVYAWDLSVGRGTAGLLVECM